MTDDEICEYVACDDENNESEESDLEKSTYPVSHSEAAHNYA